MSITASQLRAVMPTVARAEEFAAALSTTVERFDITGPKRLAALLAQVMHESAGFSRLEEGLSYSAWRLLQVWPTRFCKRDALGQIIRGKDGKPIPDMDLAARYERKPQALANYVYANRMGNGPEATGDGYRFRGRGPIQISGKDNYRACGQALGVDLLRDPDALLRPLEGCLSAGWYWASAGCNVLADKGAFPMITQRINGGQIGAAEREASYALALAKLEAQA